MKVNLLAVCMLVLLVACGRGKSSHDDTPEGRGHDGPEDELGLSAGEDSPRPRLPIASGGNDVGNGGHSVVCTAANGSRTAKLYDFWEGEATGMTSSLGDADLGIKEKVELALSRLDPLDPERATRYRTIFAYFLSSFQFTDATLNFIEDMGESPVSSGCTVEQTAVHRLGLPGQKEYLIDTNIWRLLDANSRAGLILHEIIYSEARGVNGHRSSQTTRYFNQLVSSNKIATLNATTYRDVLQRSSLTNSSDSLAFFVEETSSPTLTFEFYFPNRVAPYRDIEPACNAFDMRPLRLPLSLRPLIRFAEMAKAFPNDVVFYKPTGHDYDEPPASGLIWRGLSSGFGQEIQFYKPGEKDDAVYFLCATSHLY